MTLIEIQSTNSNKYSVPVLNIAFIAHPKPMKVGTSIPDYGGITLVTGEYIPFAGPEQLGEVIKVIRSTYDGDELD